MSNLIDELLKFLKQIKDHTSEPADLLAMTIGAILGTGLAFFLKASDFWPSITGGGTLGLVIKKIFSGLFIDHRALSKRTAKFRNRVANLEGEDAETLLKSLDCETQLWKDRLLTDDEFKTRLKDLIARYRDYFNRRK